MKQKKKIKQLMALGIQRNDAAGFVRASRIINAQHMGHLFYDKIDQRPHIIVNEREIKKFAACFTCCWEVELQLPDEEKKKYIKRRLGEELGKGLLDSGLCRIQASADVNYAAPAVTYRATIEVAVPQEVRA